MNKNKIGIFIILAGIIIILYPIISNIIASYNQTVVILTYQEQVNNLSEEEIEEELEKMKEYNQGLLDSNDIQVEGTEETENGVSNLNVLNVGEILGYIEIPKIDVYLPIYQGDSEATLQAGVGHMENTSFPIGEKGTHAVLVGHNGLVRKKIFDDLDQLEIGDKFYIYILNQKYAYEVNQIKIVDPDNSEDLGIYEDEEYVTLLTCTPYGINTHRLLVRGSRIEETEQIEENNIEITISDRAQASKKIIYMLAFLFTLILFIIIIIVVVKKRKKSQKGKHSKKVK